MRIRFIRYYLEKRVKIKLKRVVHKINRIIFFVNMLSHFLFSTFYFVYLLLNGCQRPLVLMLVVVSRCIGVSNCCSFVIVHIFR